MYIYLFVLSDERGVGRGVACGNKVLSSILIT